MEYTRGPRLRGAKFILSGGNSGQWCRCSAGEFVADPVLPVARSGDGRAMIRLVIHPLERYAIARSYMIRLKREDFPRSTRNG